MTETPNEQEHHDALEARLSALPLAEPSPALDARMSAMLSSTQPKPRAWRRHALGYAMAAALGLAFGLLWGRGGDGAETPALAPAVPVNDQAEEAGADTPSSRQLLMVQSDETTRPALQTVPMRRVVEPEVLGEVTVGDGARLHVVRVRVIDEFEPSVGDSREFALQDRFYIAANQVD